MNNISALLLKGGSGSGNFGHSGRPGLIGGSSNVGAGGIHEGNRLDSIKLWENKFKKEGILGSREESLFLVGFDSLEDKNNACKSIFETHKKLIEEIPILKEYMEKFPLFTLAISGEENISSLEPGDISNGKYSVGNLKLSKGSNSNWNEAELNIGGNIVNGTGKGIYRHELGHHINLIMTSELGENFSKIFNASSKKRLINEISWYASVSNHECFAESFSTYTHPDYGKKNKLPKEIHDFFTTNFPKKKSKVKSLSEYLIKGGSGSGNFGHSGRPGMVGGSGSGGDGSINERRNPKIMWVDDEWSKKFSKIGIIRGKSSFLSLKEFASNEEKAKACTSIFETHKNLIENFPVLKNLTDKTPVRYLYIMGTEDIAGEMGGEKKGVGGRYSEESDQIMISRGDRSKSWDQGKLTIGGGNVDYSAPGIYRHEFAHHLHANFRDLGFHFGSRSDFTIPFSKMTPVEVSRKISRYATTNAEEGFCESFSAYTHPDYGKKNKLLPKEIHDFFIKYFPKKKSKTKSLSEYLVEIKGGVGSGNFGHSGRPGQVGGSGDSNVGSLHESRRNRLREVIDNTVQSLRDPSSNPNIKLWNEARDEIYSFAKSAEGRKRESVILSVRGENIKIEGTRSETEIPMPLLRKSEYTIHNHPGSSPPSPKDLVMFMDCPNMKVMEIITANGTIYKFTKDSNNPNIRKKGIDSEFEKIEEKLHSIYSKKVNKSRSNVEEIRILEESEVNRLLAKKLGIKYEVKNISNIKFMVNMKKARVYTVQEGEEVYILDDSHDNRNPLLEYLEREDKKKIKSLSEYIIEIKGGQGSGNFGHAGRPGQIGGSGSGTGSGSLHERRRRYPGGYVLPDEIMDEIITSEQTDRDYLDEFARSFLADPVDSESTRRRNIDSDKDNVFKDGKNTLIIKAENKEEILEKLTSYGLKEKDLTDAIGLQGIESKIYAKMSYGEIQCRVEYKKRGKDLGYSEITLNNREIHFDLVRFNSKYLDKGYGKELINQVEALCKKSSTINGITLQADISIGRYAWAKLGFDYRYPEQDSRNARSNLYRYFESCRKKMNMDMTNERKLEIMVQIERCKSASDFANLKIPEFKFSKKQLEKQFLFKNEDVKSNLKMDLGKAFMLDLRDSYLYADSGHGWWNGVKKINREVKSLSEYLIKGGPGSGNFGHSGRPGLVGGSGGSNVGSFREDKNSLGNAFIESFTLGNVMPSASQSRTWAKHFKKEYDKNKNFRAAVKTAVLFCGGEFEEVAAIDKFLNTGVNSKIRGKERKVENITVADITSFMTEYSGNPFDSSSDSMYSGKEKVLDGVKELNRIFNISEPLSVPIFRGMAIDNRKQSEWDLQFLKDDWDITPQERRARLARIKESKAREKIADKVLKLKKGDSINLDAFTSFTRSKEIATQFANKRNIGQGGSSRTRLNPGLTPIVFQVEPGAKGLAVSRFSKWKQEEIISKGKFEVKSIMEPSRDNDYTKTILLRPIIFKKKSIEDKFDWSFAFSLFPALSLELPPVNKSKSKSLSQYLVEVKGGTGSGNFGHAGRPGLVGGSGDSNAGFLHENINSKLKEQLDGLLETEHAKRVKEDSKKSLIQFSVDHGLPKDKYIEKVEKEIKDYLKDTEVCIRVDKQSLLGILDDGRFKSQFEAGKSGGTYEPYLRNKFEKEIMNNKEFDYDTDKNFETATIYGYLAEKNNLVAKDLHLKSYGDIIVVLKKENRERTSFLVGDSFQNYLGPHNVPSLIDKPSIYSTGALINKNDAVEYIKNSDNKITGKNVPYYEAQIHGGVKTSDIEKVILPIAPTKYIISELKKKKIKWEVQEKKDNIMWGDN